MDICHLKNSELEPKFQKCKGRVVLRGDTVTDDSGSYTVYTEQDIFSVTNGGSRSNGCHRKTTQDAQDKQRTQYLPAPMSKLQSRNVQIFGYVYQKRKWPKSWSSMEDPVARLERNLYGDSLAGLLWKRHF